ncbi:MAG: hypothetical protein ACRC8S_05025 [Fimbriiglobus sp.]
MTTRILVVVLLSFGWLSEASAQFLAIGNLTTKPIRFELSSPTAEKNEVRQFELAPLENRCIVVGAEPEIAFTLGDQATRFRLDPYTAYLFADDGMKVGFHGLELAGKLPEIKDVPKTPPELKAGKIQVKVCFDQHEIRNKNAAEQIFKNRLEEVSTLLQKQCNMAIEVVGVDQWKSEAGDDLFASLREFERKLKAEPGVLMLGFSPKRPGMASPDLPMSMSRGPFSTHIIIRDPQLKGEGEKQEVLLKEFGHYFGAVHSPDPLSAMRLKLGNGLANSPRFKIQYDPFNLLIVNIWAKNRREKAIKTWSDLPNIDRERLEALYKTMSQLLPEDTMSQEHLLVLERVKKNPQGGAMAGPKVNVADAVPTVPKEAKLTGKVQPESVRAIVAAIRLEAERIKRLEASERPRGDNLTAAYIRAAAITALRLEESQRAAGFLVGLGVGLDDSPTLRDNFLTKDLCRAAETDVERADRINALGNPTLRNRRDLCQHFAVSAALTELLGPGAAEGAGLAKEMMDLNSTSGFSFVDIAADFAGVEMGKALKQDPKRLTKLAEGFQTDDYLPALTGLREGLSPKRFESDFGKLDDPRVQELLTEIRGRVSKCPAYGK